MQILCSVISAVKNRRITKTQPHKNALNLMTPPLSLKTVGTLIHKAYCSPHVGADGHTATGSGALFKFPEFLGSTSYM
jgi:hypothetical protein